jgi:hypothetical protein
MSPDDLKHPLVVQQEPADLLALDTQDPDEPAARHEGRDDLAFDMRQPRQRNLLLDLPLAGLLDR